MECFYCTKKEPMPSLMTPMVELLWSNVYLFKDQKHKGRVVVALKEHKDEIWQLSDEQRKGFFDEVAVVAEAVSAVAGANKINYAIYGDLVSHFHVHVVPKTAGGLQWGGPFTDDIEKVFLSEEDSLNLGRELITKITELAAPKSIPVTPKM